ncbi:hypothetical protein J4407_01430 [Candidatus Pacearchaeota archaeon]|nr:hypothetical protein [Candidatus Pacearchaeota archaeon]
MGNYNESKKEEALRYIKLLKECGADTSKTKINEQKRKTGESNLEKKSIINYPLLGGLTGVLVGGIGGAYLTNEVMNWLDAPTTIKYTGDVIFGLSSGIFCGRIGFGIGAYMLISKLTENIKKDR